MGLPFCKNCLRVACDESRKEQKLRLLLQYGADPDSKNDHGGNLEAVQMLLEAGADYNARDGNGRPAPEYAAAFPAKGKEKVCAECLRLFLDAGANPEEMLLFQYAALGTNILAIDIGVARYLLERGADKNTVDSNGTSVMQQAISGDFYEGLELLLVALADHLQVSKNVSTVLHVAVSVGDVKAMDILAGHGLGGCEVYGKVLEYQ
ncbi:ankyrin repeat-containing domain protein [Lasiosphaeria miniovina]|uniref:Ankyrin repeat-containing domain protein n=1 Tax=Lasiosphaeria miniovina TaxID=1954250 RepID=A0AA39ZZB9_9PEZI|nr:ankyrin repeat-containing domain protein [Lasiosphaeria miniovina]KAK0706350.1 ankyrin repeat-containing domain protein [Lasiosphaeria miniovina]